jgi:hypothetical protein
MIYLVYLNAGLVLAGPVQPRLQAGHLALLALQLLQEEKVTQLFVPKFLV